MKKIKYLLLAPTLISLAVIPTTIVLISCSKKQVDIIEHYKDAEGAKFYDENDYETIMTKEQTPFKCDFNITQKICTIIEWTSDFPNYISKKFPSLAGSGSIRKPNTLRIPSKVLYKNEYYDVISFCSLYPTSDIKNLDIDRIGSTTLAIQFDNRLEGKLQVTTYSGPKIINNAFRFNRLVEILNFPSNLGFTTSHYENLEVFTFNRNSKSDRYIFEECPKLKTIYLPDSTSMLRENCFYKCSSLVSINIPYSVTSIGDDAFSCCSNLQYLTIPISLTSIGRNAFNACWNLQKMVIPNSVTSIGTYAFYGCRSLQSIDIPNSVKEFGVDIFSSREHPDGFKINFHSQQTMDLFLKTNPDDAKYCQLLSN